MIFSRAKYGRHKRYGEWLEQNFINIKNHLSEVVATYKKAGVARPAQDDRENIEEVIQWYILALYQLYFVEVLLRTPPTEGGSEYKDHELPVSVVLQAMTSALRGEEMPSKICADLLSRSRELHGALSPEYIAAEHLMSQFDFSLFSGRSSSEFRNANVHYFQLVRDKRIEPALVDFFGNDDSHVGRVMEIARASHNGLKSSIDKEWEKFMASTDKGEEPLSK